MIGKNSFLNYFVTGTQQMLSLVDQKKHHAKKDHTAILQVMIT